ncbi:twitching motility protein PilT [Bacteroidia bacterium]|nr:twitching motility protein PilT [Bacteroidia bacterium]
MWLINKKIRVILDTNLWISLLITPNSIVDDVLSIEGVQFIFSQDLLSELHDVTIRPKFRKYFSIDKMEELLKKIRKYTKIVRIKTVVTQCRDPKDNFLLELAIDGKAHFLLTGDSDLLDIKEFGKTSIIKVKDFLSVMQH